MDTGLVGASRLPRALQDSVWAGGSDGRDGPRHGEGAGSCHSRKRVLGEGTGGHGAADTAVLPAHGGACASPVFSFVVVGRVIVTRRTHGVGRGNTGTFLLQRWGELLGTTVAQGSSQPACAGGGPGLSKCQKVQIQAWPLTKNRSAAEDPGGVLCVPTAPTKRPSPLPALRRAVRTAGPGDTRGGGRGGVSPRALSAGIAPG